MFEGVELLELGQTLAAADRRGLPAAERLAGVVELVRFQSLLATAVAHELADVDADGLCDMVDGMSTATWVAREAETAPKPLGRDLRAGKVLRTKLSIVDDAVSAGEVSFAHARVFVDAAANRRVGDQVAELQDEFLEAAAGCTFGRWRAEITSRVNLLDQDGGHDPNEDLMNNKLSLSSTLDGMVKLDGQYTPEVGELFRQQVEAKADELFRQYTADAKLTPDLEVPPRRTLLALALAELVFAGNGVDLHSTVAPRVAASFVVPAEHPDHAYDNNGVRLADGSVRVLLCDADWYPFVVNNLGAPLDAGRMARFALPRQRRAIAIRDGGCIFPGCENPISWCDFHHTVGFKHDGGETNLNELAPLCRRHHGVVHRKGWNMHATHDGWFWFQTPSGDRFWSQRHQRKRPDAPPFPEPTEAIERRSSGDPPPRSQAA